MFILGDHFKINYRKEDTENAKKKGNSTKILVRNIPFHATEDEITDLFK